MKNIIQADYSKNRYYLDNPKNFLILRNLWLSEPAQYARMLKKTKPQRSRGMDSYIKYHPIYEWINIVIAKYTNISTNLKLTDKVKFILKDLTDFEKKHKWKISIYEIYPDTDKTDSILKEIKQLIDKNPMNWGWLLTNVKKYNYMLNYINNNTPKLQDKKYSLVTKLQWILDGLTDFPKCANPNCKNILDKNSAKKLTIPRYKFCSAKCVQEAKQHKPHSYFKKRIYRKCTKHLNSIFESKNSKYKIQYFKIIDKYKKLNLKYTKKSIYITNPNLYYERHHICPRWFYITNCIDIVNKDNIVIVPYIIHIKLHILLVKHFKYIDDKRNYYKAVRACLAFFNTHKLQIRNKIKIPINIYKQLLNIKNNDYSKISSIYNKSKKLIIDINTGETKIVPIMSPLQNNIEVVSIDV